MIDYHVDQAGFRNRLVCGTINYFDGWIVAHDRSNPVISVSIRVGPRKLGDLPVRNARPDLARVYDQKLVGFSGVVEIPEALIGYDLCLEAIARDGSVHPMKQYPLTEKLGELEKRYRRENDLPDDLLMHLVVHNVDPQAFLAEGKFGVELLRTVCERNGISIDSIHDVLDFGVGCGRVLRWWQPLAERIHFHGTDLNPKLIEWCTSHLPFGRFAVNGLKPPLAYADSQIDLLYAFSVFTHLSKETQELWLAEFLRILRPGGYALISVHGDYHARMMVDDLYQKFKSNGYYILAENAEGENMCATYESKEFSERLFSTHFLVLDYAPQALISCGGQDLFLLQSKK